MPNGQVLSWFGLIMHLVQVPPAGIQFIELCDEIRRGARGPLVVHGTRVTTERIPSTCWESI